MRQLAKPACFLQCWNPIFHAAFVSDYNSGVPPGTKDWSPWFVMTALLLASGWSAVSRPLVVTGQPMSIKPPTTRTNSFPIARWHTITVSPDPGRPEIHFYQKLNPVWWLENADEPTAPAWYLPEDRHRDLKWQLRNPFHNFDHYVIGVADKKFYRSGKYPERNSNPHGGWDFAVARRSLALLPFVSYERSRCTFYFGWREHGAFGIELKLHSAAPPQPK